MPSTYLIQQLLVAGTALCAGLLVAVLSLVLVQVIFHRLEGKFAQEL